ncbi:Cob(I)yrinic acid a,c-diamide adenosyltransferase [bioreactor metagenome]|uniref:Cob(I)yrinic acid a,c-diamide adenosyltransferase n=1 Tax=bioreactor metagenome TaxID=1076179 RepID=A0A644T0C9_9ZZZZ|nr:cob(I)yrinic acid a,c-diamide adenosyltransferase [Negativicutes bacterium]
MKVYTKTGDKGTTSLLSGERVDKDSLRVEAYGAVDEITSTLGLARALCKRPEVTETILKLQHLLMKVMAQLASKDDKISYITIDHVNLLEKAIDSFEEQLPPLKEFLIPGDTPGAAALDMARTITRRAERQVLRLAKNEPVDDAVIIALNRLSDLCFVLMRFERQ